MLVLQEGKWKLVLLRPDDGPVNVSVQVWSSPREKGHEAIRAKCYVGNALVDDPYGAKIYALVTKGRYVILNAVVHATVTRPNAPHVVGVELLDDGQGR